MFLVQSAEVNYQYKKYKIVKLVHSIPKQNGL